MKIAKFTALPPWLLLIVLQLVGGITSSQALSFSILLASPTNSQSFAAPATIAINAGVADSNVVRSVQFFASGGSVGVVSNTTSLLLTNTTQSNPFSLSWTNVSAGSYTLTAVGTDSASHKATSAPVNITVTGTAPRPSPFAAIYSPTNGTTYSEPANVHIYARAYETNGLVSNVQFFANGTSLGIVASGSQQIFTNISPSLLFPLTWSNVVVGSYALTAVATDTNGYTATSSVANIFVVTNLPPPPAPAPVPFAIKFLSPTNTQPFFAPANLSLRTGVSDSNIVSTVEYFANGIVLGMVTNTSSVLLTNTAQSNPFLLAWSNVPAGNYTLIALATDTSGNQATSAPVNITITSSTHAYPPFVAIFSPTNGSYFTEPANVHIYVRAYETNGLVSNVQFFANGTSLGIVASVSQQIFTNISPSLLFPLTWSNVVIGSYALTAIATDTNGIAATSSVANIFVITNTPPPPPPPVPFAIKFFSPTNTQPFIAPATIGLHVGVSDSNVVSTMEYFANGTSLGAATNVGGVLLTNSTQTNPFFLAWSNVSVGSYTLVALATDTGGNQATSAPVMISVITNTPPPPPPPVAFAIKFLSPTNTQPFIAPATIGLHAGVSDSNVISTVEFFANGTSLGAATNASSVLLTNTAQSNPFFLSWSNVSAGSYILTALATDTTGVKATSAPVNITVTGPVIPPLPYAAIYSPVFGAHFAASTNVPIYARAFESNTTISKVEFFANNFSLGVVSNASQHVFTNISSLPLFELTWTNPAAGSYLLKVIATDAAGYSGPSSLVLITITNRVVPPPLPFALSLLSPTNGQVFNSPASFTIHSWVTDSNVVRSVEYFANGSSIGVVSNSSNLLLTNSTQSNPFTLQWTNIPAGNYTLTALARDSASQTASSTPVNIYVLSNFPPVISIYAPDPVAVESTNAGSWFHPNSATTNYVNGSNTATFLVHRATATNTDLTVNYTVSGTAINGVDYEEIPGSVIIPSGKTFALITINPLADSDSAYRYYDTVTLSLTLPATTSNAPLPYLLGTPRQAGAIILEESYLPIPNPMIQNMADSSLHLSLPATNGLNYRLECSTNLVTWQPVCTNTVLKGSAQFVDPSAGTGPGLYYRIVPVANPASY